MYNAITVHEHGFIRVINVLGDDTTICNAARVSYGNHRSEGDNKRLINYLMKNRHTSPFEMCEITFHICLPIFVARQWLRHRTASVNEISARYTELEDVFYYPSIEDMCKQSEKNKQGRGSKIDYEIAKTLINHMRETCINSYNTYQTLLSQGVAREIARMVLPVNIYTEMYWKIDLHNLLHFLKLRLDPHAQKEIRDYAQVISGIVAEWVPITWAAFKEHVLTDE